MQDKKSYNKNFFDSCKNALCGIIYGIKTQRNVRIQIIMVICSIIAGIFFGLEKVEFMALMFSVILIIIVEMINTSIETTVDLFCDIYHPKAKVAKDGGAGAVVLSAINFAVVCYFLFFDKIIAMLLNVK